MTWLESVANLLTTGAILSYGAWDLYSRWQRGRSHTQVEPAPSFGSTGRSGGQRARTVHTSAGPGWTSTTITFGDSSQPGVLTLHNLLGPDYGESGAAGDVHRFVEELFYEVASHSGLHGLPHHQASTRDFTEADYEMLSALDDGIQWRPAAVSDGDVAALPTHMHHPSPAKGGSGAEESACEGQACSICLEDFAAGDEVKTLPCLHHYHTECVTRWLRVKGRSVACPVCKTPVFAGQA